MTSISYFPRYTQRENFTTNNTLLLLHRLYDDNRRRFQRFLGLLLEEKADAPIAKIGLQISQQVATKSSVLDGYLHQPAVRIAVETKRYSSDFNVDQLLGHLGAFEPGSSGYLLMLSPGEVNLATSQFKVLNEEAAKRDVIVAAITFEKVIDSFRQCLKEHDEAMHELVDDYEAFCSEEELLNTDTATMFVPPCGLSFDINVECNLYCCPADWSRRQVRYLGIYKDKSVRYIGVIDRVLRADLEANGTLVFKDEAGNPEQASSDEAKRVRKAIEMGKKQNQWDLAHGYKFFMCSGLAATDYRKTSRGGIFNFRYLNLSDYIKPSMSLAAIADELKARTWS